jgi:hypothetical protein
LFRYEIPRERQREINDHPSRHACTCRSHEDARPHRPFPIRDILDKLGNCSSKMISHPCMYSDTRAHMVNATHIQMQVPVPHSGHTICNFPRDTSPTNLLCFTLRETLFLTYVGSRAHRTLTTTCNFLALNEFRQVATLAVAANYSTPETCSDLLQIADMRWSGFPTLTLRIPKGE